MINGKKVLAVIPARAGSQGLAGKNIRLFHGKPLIAWTIEAALGAGLIDKVIVSTDSEEYAAIARTYGAEVPFLRPAELATSTASTADTVSHALSMLASESFDIVVKLQPTSPLRRSHHIVAALQQFAQIDAPQRSLVSVVPLARKYAWVLQQQNGFIQFIDPGLRQQTGFMRQSNPAVYLPNGAIFIADTADFAGFYTTACSAFEMTEAESVDIDDEADFQRAVEQASNWFR